MSRDGSGIYHLPSGLYPQAPNTTIESGDWNNLVADLEQDANIARPIVAGGTGATTVALARTSLQAERSMQQVTLNYTGHPWETGSFFNAAVTGLDAPVDGRAYTGIALVVDANNIILQARDI